MIDCQMEQGKKHSWSVIGHSTGPAALLFLECGHCGAQWCLRLTDEEWGDYLNELSEAGRVWVARHLGLPDPFEAHMTTGDHQLVGHYEDENVTLKLWKINKTAGLIDDLDLFDEGDGDVPF